MKLLSKKKLAFFRKYILHFVLKISGYKNFGSFSDTGEEYFLNQIIKDDIKNCLDIGAHFGSFSERLLEKKYECDCI